MCYPSVTWTRGWAHSRCPQPRRSWQSGQSWSPAGRPACCARALRCLAQCPSSPSHMCSWTRLGRCTPLHITFTHVLMGEAGQVHSPAHHIHTCAHGRGWAGPLPSTSHSHMCSWARLDRCTPLRNHMSLQTSFCLTSSPLQASSRWSCSSLNRYLQVQNWKWASWTGLCTPAGMRL